MGTAMKPMTPPSDSDLTVNGILDILRVDIRRAMIETIDGGGELGRDALVESVADRIGYDVDEVEVAIHHGHLPQLASYGVVEVNDGVRNNHSPLCHPTRYGYACSTRTASDDVHAKNWAERKSIEWCLEQWQTNPTPTTRPVSATTDTAT